MKKLEREHVWAHRNMSVSAFDSVDAEMRIVAVGARSVRSNARKVLLRDLSPDSLHFQTTLWMPPDGGWIIALRFHLEGIPLEMEARIAEASGERGWWTYRAELDPGPVKRAILVRVLGFRLKKRAPLLYRIYARDHGLFGTGHTDSGPYS